MVFSTKLAFSLDRKAEKLILMAGRTTSNSDLICSPPSAATLSAVTIFCSAVPSCLTWRSLSKMTWKGKEEQKVLTDSLDCAGSVDADPRPTHSWHRRLLLLEDEEEEGDEQVLTKNIWWGDDSSRLGDTVRRTGTLKSMPATASTVPATKGRSRRRKE